MTPSPAIKSDAEFSSELYLEHLEEASFLYSQRCVLLAEGRLPWPDVAEFEERLEAHLDALVLGGEAACDVCRERITEGDAGELFAAISVFCRLGARDDVETVQESLDAADTDRMQAMTDALIREMPDEWQDACLQSVAEDKPHAARLLARLAGFRRLSAGDALLKLLPGKASSEAADILQALGKIRYVEAAPVLLEQYLFCDDEALRLLAAQALMMMGEIQALEHCRSIAATYDWADLLLGISADRWAATVLIEKARERKVGPDSVLALGLSGDVEVVETLLAYVTEADTAGVAARALNLITGAEIYEDVFIPEKMDEEEMFPEEIEDLRQGRYPTRPDGKPYGENITRLSQNPADWEAWWAANSSLFSSGSRYRFGKPFTPVSLLETLQRESTPSAIRQLAYDELVIRYGLNLPFETGMTVVQQNYILPYIAQWVAECEATAQPGVWYFAGNPLET